MMKIERYRNSAAHPARALGLLLLTLSGMLLSGCNAGIIGLAIWLALDDDGGGGGKQPQPPIPSTEVEVVFDHAADARRNPAQTVLSFILLNDDAVTTEIRIDYASEGKTFRPATLSILEDGSLGDPGVVTGLITSKAGRLHRVGWDALTDLGGDDSAQSVEIRLTTVSKNTDVATILVGNDAPLLRDLQISAAGDGDLQLSFVLEDSTSDPTDVAVHYTTSSGDIASAALEEGTTTGGLALLTSPAGESHAMTWRSIVDLGRVDRDVQVRIVPTDRVEGFPGKSGDPVDAQLFLDNNSPPEAQLLSSEILADPDARRGQAVWFALRDADSDPVDAIIQWSPEGEPFPDLPAGLLGDPAAREALLADAEGRRALRIITALPEIIEGPVEEPDSGVLQGDVVRASWLVARAELRGLRGAAEPVDAGDLLVADLVGRRVEIIDGSGAAVERRVCSFDPFTGALRLSEAVDPPAAPGSILRIDLGGMLLARSSAEWLRHRVIWASDIDLPGGGRARLRITPYETIAGLDGRPEVACFGETGFPAENASIGDAGAESALEEAKDLAGPFGARDPLVADLYPTDEPAALAVDDIDGDGRQDIIAAVRGSRAVVLLLQTAPGWFDVLRYPDARLGAPAAVSAADLDGDDDLDVVIAFEQPGGLMIFYQADSEPFGDFATQRASFADLPLETPSAMVADDLDGDGDIDLAIADASEATSPVVILYRGASPAGASGCGALQNGYTPCPVGASEAARHLVLADVDGDGKEDLVITRAGGVTILHQEAAGVFDQRVVQVDAAGSDLIAAAVRDADGDGDQDIIALDAAGPRAVLLAQESAGSFVLSTLVELPDLEAPAGLAVADLQGL
ncbi:MAG: VCBS repeat-containing protein, partial [Planctomycetes bacterium]|nr:VCBS repeat-containing protein [Planctomycetota bacterium]